MQLKQIFEYTLMNFLTEYDSLRAAGYEVSQQIEHYPAYINGGFFCMMAKAEVQQEQVLVTETSTETVVEKKPTRGRRPASE